MTLLAILFGIFFFFAALGMPIAHAMLPAVIVTYLLIGFDLPLQTIASTLIGQVDQWIWLTIPLFLILGNSMNETGITDKLINLSQEIVGHLRGGLSHVGVVTNTLMAGISGSANADAAATGTIHSTLMFYNFN